jgi:uncharacterized protein DUF3291
LSQPAIRFQLAPVRSTTLQPAHVAAILLMTAVAYYHLAQLNIGRIRAQLEHPSMQGFVSRLPQINALAEASPGFVWRLQTDEGNATGLRPFEDPAIIVNMSVWGTPERLKAFVYRGGHAGPLRQRLDWFEPMPHPFQVLWWVPAGHRPTVDEARARLDHLARQGDSPVAFGFAKLAPPPPSPEADPVPVDGFLLDRRHFVLEANEPDADCKPGMTFAYRQEGGRVWALYGGADVLFGTLVGCVSGEGRLDVRYQHATANGLVRTGRCDTRVENLVDGKLRLHEEWQWLTGAEGIGRSTLVEG